MVGTLAAQEKTDVAALVALAGAGLPVGAIIRRQLEAAGSPAHLRDAANRLLTELEGGRAVADAPAELASLFRPSGQPYLMSWLRLDPAAELAKLHAPILIVQGTTDLQVTRSDAERLAAARPDAELAFIEGMNHVLKTAPMDREANFATYTDPDQSIAPELIERIAAFLQR